MLKSTTLIRIESGRQADRRVVTLPSFLASPAAGAGIFDRHDREVDNAVARRQAVHEEELLAETEPGLRILKLRQEKENLLDTVWLATSSKQIKELWSKVAEILGDEQTPLQQDALAIPAFED